MCRSTLAIYLLGLAQLEKEKDSLTRANTDNRLTDDLTLLRLKSFYFLYISGFECPYGIKIFKVYVTQKQYKKIMAVAAMSPYKQDKNKDTNNTEAQASRKRITKLPLPYKGKHDSDDSHLKSSSRESLCSEFDTSLSGSFDALSVNGKTSRSKKDCWVHNVDGASQSSVKKSTSWTANTQLSRQIDLPVVRAPPDPSLPDDSTDETNHQQENVCLGSLA